MSASAWIPMIAEDQASGELAELYQRHLDPTHQVVDNILKIHSLKPRTLRDHGNLYRTTMYAASQLSRAEREMIAVVVSSLNDCHY